LDLRECPANARRDARERLDASHDGPDALKRASALRLPCGPQTEKEREKKEEFAARQIRGKDLDI